MFLKIRRKFRVGVLRGGDEPPHSLFSRTKMRGTHLTGLDCPWNSPTIKIHWLGSEKDVIKCRSFTSVEYHLIISKMLWQILSKS